MKKSIKIKALVNQVNHMLLHSIDSLIDGREALIDLIEKVLIDSGNYHGFWYLTFEDMKESDNGTSIGIRFSDDEHKNPVFENTDHTRVQYF